jgi:hypothetical protein
MARSFMNTLKYRGYLRKPREAGFVDIEEVDGFVRAWSPDGLAGVAYGRGNEGDNNRVRVWAVNRDGLPIRHLNCGESLGVGEATYLAAEEWEEERERREAEKTGR